jgi:ATP-dependent Lon protease
LRLPDGTVKAVLEGGGRATLVDDLSTKELFQVRVQELEELEGNPIEVEALMRTIRDTLEQWARLIRKTPEDTGFSLSSIDDPRKLADTVAAHLDLKLSDEQDILETRDKRERLEKVFRLLKAEIEIMGLERKIHTRVHKQIGEGQKEYFLNEQMRAIQKELGEKDEFKSEIDELEARRRKKKMSKEAHEKVKKEIKRLGTMSPMSPEGTVVRNYIDWILSLPWQEYTQEEMDIEKAEHILEEDHYGLKKVKERMLEYLAVRAPVDKMKPLLSFYISPAYLRSPTGFFKSTYLVT